MQESVSSKIPENGLFFTVAAAARLFPGLLAGKHSLQFKPGTPVIRPEMLEILMNDRKLYFTECSFQAGNPAS
jgi:hypothetical protein